MFFRHMLAMIAMVVGAVVGLIIAVVDSWQAGVITAAVICGAAMIFAILNMALAMRKDF